MLAYLLAVKVFTNSWHSTLEAFNEIFIFLAGYHMIILISDENLSNRNRKHVGLSLILIIQFLATCSAI